MNEKEYEAYEEYEDYTLTKESQEEIQGIRGEQEIRQIQEAREEQEIRQIQEAREEQEIGRYHEVRGDQQLRLGQEEDLNWEEDLDQEEQLIEENELIQEDELSQEEDLSQQDTLDEEELDKEKVFESAIIEQDTKKFQYQENTSFRNYTRKSKQEGTKGFKKWFIRLIKLVIFLMCLPFLGLLLVGIVGAGGTIIGGGIASVGLGIYLLVASAFFSSYLGGSLIALGIMLSITFTAAGILILLFSFLGIRSVIRGVKYYREKRKQRLVEEGGR